MQRCGLKCAIQMKSLLSLHMMDFATVMSKKYQQHKNSSEATVAVAAYVCQISRAPTSNHNKIQKGEYSVCKGKQSTGINCFLQQTGRFSMLDPKQRRAAS